MSKVYIKIFVQFLNTFNIFSIDILNLKELLNFQFTKICKILIGSKNWWANGIPFSQMQFEGAEHEESKQRANEENWKKAS